MPSYFVSMSNFMAKCYPTHIRFEPLQAFFMVCRLKDACEAFHDACQFTGLRRREFTVGDRFHNGG